MMWDKYFGCELPGKMGKSTHCGKPLSVREIESLGNGQEVVITWSGGNGPHKYKIIVDKYGVRRVNNIYKDSIIRFDGQKNPLHRVTLI